MPANVTQVNDARRLNKQQLHDGVIRGAGVGGTQPCGRL